MASTGADCESCQSRRAEYQRNDARLCAQCLLHDLVGEGIITKLEAETTPWSVVIPD